MVICLCAATVLAPCVGSAADTTMASSTRDSLYQIAREQHLPEWHAMFTNIPGDWARLSNQTFRARNLSAIFGMTALTGMLIVTDDESWKISDRWYQSSTNVRDMSDFFEYLGDGRPQFGLAGAFALYGFAAGDTRALRTASQVVQAIFACGVVIQVIKHVTGRESPLVATRPGGRWDFFPNQIEYHKKVPHYDAYPSGHIATALATVTVVAENYPEWFWVKPIGYTIVGLIGVAMANTGIHWYSDYPLGLFLGYSFGKLAANPEGLLPEEPGEAGGPKLSIAPLLVPRGAGVSLSLDF